MACDKNNTHIHAEQKKAEAKASLCLFIYYLKQMLLIKGTSRFFLLVWYGMMAWHGAVAFLEKNIHRSN